jgi:outer membrane cobalamin receptor
VDNAITSTQPRFVLTGEISYREKFFDDALDARFCMRGQFMSAHTGTRFFPASGVFAENTGRNIGAFSTVDLYGVFHIGDAFVTMTWENPFDREFMTVYPYPAMNRNVRIGLNWIFLD